MNEECAHVRAALARVERRLFSGGVILLFIVLGAALAQSSWSDDTAVDMVAGPIRSLAVRIWEYQLYEDKVTGYVLTVQAVCAAALLLVTGTIASRRVSRWITRRGLLRAGVEEHLAASIEKGLYYALFVMVALLALYIVNVPLTAFAIFGGALAIGVGFGAQNLINNFISGLILMIERPIRVGDLIEVDGQQGSVVNIGARCSQVRLFDGVDILVPNSVFLEKKVVNLTLSDAKLRFSVRAVAPFGADLREAARLLLQAASEHASVLSDPEPQVIFSELGEKTRALDVFFWIDGATSPDGRVVCSDVRFRVDELFRIAGIGAAPTV